MAYQSIGVDIVHVERFSHWSSYSEQKLSKVFAPQEIIEYKKILAASGPQRKVLERAAQFLASRFAVKEAFFKALCSLPQQENLKKIVFLKLCRNIYVEKGPRSEPLLKFNLGFNFDLETIISLSHESCCVVATIMLRKS